MGIILGILFLASLFLNKFCFWRIRSVRVTHPVSIKSLSIISGLLVLLLTSGYLLNLVMKGTYYSFSVYFEATIFGGLPGVLGIIFSYLPNGRLRKFSIYMMSVSIAFFLVTNLWAFIGPSLSIFGLVPHN